MSDLLPELIVLVIDSSCLFWYSGTTGERSCHLYDLENLRHSVIGVILGLKDIYTDLILMALVLRATSYKSKLELLKNTQTEASRDGRDPEIGVKL